MLYLKNHFIQQVKNKNVILIGSAPGFNGKVSKADNEVVVTVNGASLILENDVTPDISFINGSSISQASSSNFRDRLGDIQTRHMVIIEGLPQFSQDWPRLLEETQFDSFDFYSHERKMYFFKHTLGIKTVKKINDIPSTGFLVLLLLLLSGAKSIKLYGFSLIGGYSYQENKHKRPHIEMDMKVIKMIQKNNWPVFGKIESDFDSIVLSS